MLIDPWLCRHRRLPSLDEPAAGTCCGVCGEPLRLCDPPYCGACEEREEGYVLSDGRATGIEAALVAEVATVLEFYGCDMGPLGPDVAAHAILAARAWRERRAAEERGHAAARERAAREMAALLGLVEARRRTRARTAMDDAL